jgi:hypothetical protein
MSFINPVFEEILLGQKFKNLHSYLVVFRANLWEDGAG